MRSEPADESQKRVFSDTKSNWSSVPKNSSIHIFKMTVNRDLDKLFNQIDAWFTEITLNEPISQFVLDEDRSRLELIYRTTTGWFKALSDPLTNEGIEDDNSDCETLDSLAKDLELLLEKDEDSEYYYHYSYDADDEIALLDDSLGHCCTAMTSVPNRKKEFNVIVQSNFSDARYERKHEDLSIQTSMPPDHDYLPRPRTKPLVLSNTLIQSFRNRQRESVLNTGAIKRFARFSKEFSVLSNKHAGTMG